jgi:hypothetical protein
MFLRHNLRHCHINHFKNWDFKKNNQNSWSNSLNIFVLYLFFSLSVIKKNVNNYNYMELLLNIYCHINTIESCI